MKPRDRVLLQGNLANALLESLSFGRIQSLLARHRFSTEFVQYNQEKVDFIFDVLDGGSEEDVISLAKDFDVPIPGETKDPVESNPLAETSTSPTLDKKIFISHSSKDKDVVGKLISYIRAMGISHTKIFCSSFSGYGIPLGDDFLIKIKNEISSDTIVLFVLSPNFYDSPVSLCEMGAAWVNSKEHIPVIIPPFDFGDIKGVIPNSQGMKINDKEGLNNLKARLEDFFNLRSIDVSIWESERNSIFYATETILKERSKPNAKVIREYSRMLKELTKEDLKILDAIYTNDGAALGLDKLMNETDYGDDLVRNLERMGLVDLTDDKDLKHKNFYFLTFFGMNFIKWVSNNIE